MVCGVCQEAGEEERRVHAAQEGGSDVSRSESLGGDGRVAGTRSGLLHQVSFSVRFADTLAQRSFPSDPQELTKSNRKLKFLAVIWAQFELYMSM